jgi:LPXTG-motif cell wall-anchored protein
MWKKYISFVSIILLTTSFFNFNNIVYSYDSNEKTILSDESLLLHYGFDNIENNVIEDLSGNNNNAITEGNAKIEESGFVDTCLDLDGESAVKLPDNLFNGLSEVTISSWINLKADNRNMEAWQRIFDFGLDTNNNFFLSKNRQVEVKVNGVVDNIGYGSSYNSDEWVHIAITAGNGNIAYYENGVKIKEKSTEIDFADLFDKSSNNYIGKSKYSADPKMNGRIDEFRVYNKALDEETINNIMYYDISDDLILENALKSLQIQGLNSVYNDLNLPKTLDNEVSVKWSSNKPEVISNEGKVVRPEGDKAVEVILKAELSRKDSNLEKEFKAYVMPIGLVNYTLNVNADEKLFDISDMLFGLFFEDINHGADGGLYAELIENRSFQYTNSLSQWVISKGSGSEAKVNTSNPINENNDKYLTINNVDSNEVKLSNDGYKGISVKSAESYDLSFWARNISNDNSIYAQIEDSKGNIISDTIEVKLNDKDWKKYSSKLTVNTTTSSAKFILYTKSKGSLDIDMISLFPKENVNSYGLREDLVNRLKELNTSFLRFPGGCVIEGSDKEQMYDWKNTIGNIEERKEIENLWGYSQSYGLGFYEYLLLSEELDAVPVPILNAGMSCQGGIHNGKSEWMAEIGDELNEYIQDALDFIEYCNGDGTGTWSSKRVAAGHKEPFNLKYLGIGNEQWGEEYFKRFEEFQKVINEKYPDIVLISAAGPIAEGEIYDEAWDWINEKASNTIVDEHYYMEPEWFLANTNRYDNFDRNGAKVFIGEYASKSNTLKSAIAEAAYFTGIEKNSDIIKMTSYAPLFAKADDYQWAPDMIWFNGETSYGSANFYVQKLLGNNIGTQMLQDELIKTQVGSNDITGGIALGAWSTKVQYDNVVVKDNNSQEVILSDDFDADASKWENIKGNWQVNNGKMELNEIAENCMLISNEKNMSNYTLELTARKNSGNEGFLIGFGAKNSSDYYWLNMGGWNNTQTVVEKSVGGKKSTIASADAKFDTVKSGVDYNVKIVVNGDAFKCYINDELAMEYEPNDIFTSSSYDEETGDIIVKVVNTSSDQKQVKINLNTDLDINGTAKVQYVQSDSLTDVNSFANPEKVNIKERTIENVSNSFVYDADKYSANVIRINFNSPEVPEEPENPENPDTKNEVPVINAKDIEINIGDSYSPLDGVTANDKEDGDLTDKIVVLENTVDITKAGDYKVVFSVKDNNGQEVFKEIKVTVKEKANNNNSNNNGNNNGNNGTNNGNNNGNNSNGNNGNTNNNNSNNGSNNNKNNKLPSTGGRNTSLIFLGAIVVIGAGFFLIKKGKIKKEQDK